MNDIVERLNDSLSAGYSELRKEAAEEIERLRAKVEAMKRQEPVAWMNSRNGFICKENKNPDYNVPLYAIPGAQTQGEEK